MSAATLAPAPLLPLIAAGDDSAMDQLVRRFTPFVRSIAWRTGSPSADDLVQETMVRLWRFADRFDPARGSEPTFIAKVARNAATDLARKEACRPSTPSEDIQDLLPPLPAAGDDIVNRLAVRDAVASLKPTQREVLRLAYFEELSQQEIADRLDLPLGTVKSRTFHALRALKAALREPA
jgi:RNA polymerase sigma-70 factor, ECF subfamily